jgi:hypothetical protein
LAEAPPDVVEELYGAPLEEFVALRDARARELRAAGSREEADAVKRLRKPSVAGWAVNQIRRRDPDAIDGLMAAGAALRQARSGALRNATREEREAVTDLVDQAARILRERSSSTIDDVRETLHAAAIDETARELVASGRVVEPVRAVGFGVTPGGRPGRSRRDRPQGGRAREDRRVTRAREALRAAQAEVRDRERELRTAERDLRAAERDADKARAALVSARERLERRESDLADARPD